MVDVSDPFPDQVALDQSDGATVGALDVKVKWQSQLMVNRRNNIFAEVLIADRLAPLIVRGTENAAAGNPRTRHDGKSG